MGDRYCPEGSVWVCCACGKYLPTTDLYEFTGGWDESCMLNAQAFPRERLQFSPGGGRVLQVFPAVEAAISEPGVAPQARSDAKGPTDKAVD